MLTVLESIKLSTEYLGKKGVESPRINAELLLAHILKCKRLDLYLTFDRPLSDEEVTLYRSFLKRRGEYEPLQYIVGSVEFYGLPFLVNSSVLIPRQETEILVEEIIEQNKKDPRIKILDIGTGSGNIAVALAKHLPGSKVVASDLSKDALEIAGKNSVQNGTESQVKFIENDILKSYPDEKEFDVIVSNPPYVSGNDFEKLRPELKVYEPRQALTDDADGLIYYREISLKAKELLRPGGRLYFETGEGQSQAVRKILEENNYKSVMTKNDYLNIERVVSGELI
jgi:release factor glutamine methyltransferase